MTKVNNINYDKLIRQAVQHELQKIKADIFYYIEKYVKIEDKSNDSGEIIVPFQLWPAQRDALSSLCDNKLNIILKARQLGFSWLCLSYISWYMMCNPQSLVIGLSRSETEAKELIRRLADVIYGNMHQLVSEDGKHGRFRVDSSSLSVKLVYPDGRCSVFSAFASGKGAGRSFTADILYLDEWAFQQFAREIWASAFPTINRPNGGKVIGLSTIERGTLFEDLWVEENNFNKIFIPWSADPRRNEHWYEETRKSMGDLILQEYPATPEEALTIPGGAFFPEFKEEIHCKPYVHNSNSTKYASFDFGLDCFAVLLYEVDENGHVQVYKELAVKDKAVTDAVKCFEEFIGKDVIRRRYAPPDLWNRNNHSGKSTAQVFKENGYPLTKTSNVLEQGWLNVKEYLRVEEADGRLTTAMTVDPDGCPELVKCLKKIQKDKNRPNICAKDPHDLTHLPDSLRAFCMGKPRHIPQKAKEKEYAFDNVLKKNKKERFEVMQVL